jgi:hypothetical protein
MPDNKTRIEEMTVSGESLLAKVKEVVKAGNIRRITIKDMEDKTLFEIPLTIGVIGAILLPVWAAIGAIAALAVNYKIVIEKIVE